MPRTDDEPDHTRLWLGLSSGTSADGIDAALVRFDAAGSPQIVAARTAAYARDLREEILALSQAAIAVDLDRVGHLDQRIGAAFAVAALDLLDASGQRSADVAAIGSHGQTLRHAPRADAPFTWQIGDPNVIAERTGILTVADFRRRDVAAGGQGAPLMPAFHRAMLARFEGDLAVLNLGGIANLTLLPRKGPVRGFDTGPANGLMDAWTLECYGEPFDAGGRFAATGEVDEALLERLLADPYFELPPPKSTGRDHFHLAWLQQQIGDQPPAAADVLASLLECTARSIVAALQRHLPAARQVLACGGGVHNASLMHRLAELLPGVRVDTTAQVGVDPDFVEAAGFAWLARQTLAGRSGNLPEVTGASGPRVLGAIHPA